MPESTQSHPEQSTSPLAWLAAVLILFPALARTLVVYLPFPWWDSDPLMSLSTGTAITPVGILILDLVMLLGAALAAWTSGARTLFGSVLLTLGAIGVLFHATNNLEHLVIAGPWIAGLAGMLAAAWLGRDPRIRSVMLGLGLGVAAMYLARSSVQVWIEHPIVLADFAENRELRLASRGWELGSPQALIYERRLSQPDASAWFSLSNLLASFAAAAAVFGAVSFSMRHDRGPRFVSASLALIGLCLLWMTGSKGGWGAAAIGLIAAGAYSGLGRWNKAPRLRSAIPLLITLGVLGIIAARGWIGESLSELSLLFRAQYLEASIRIFSSHPLTGVGPAGFQDAYLIAKNPLNPEEVTSPHSVLFDWLATLGLFMVPWALLLLRRGMIPRAEQQEPAAPDPDQRSSDPVSIRVVFLLPIAAFMLSAWFERDLLLPLDLGARVIGLSLWIAIASLFVRSKVGSGIRPEHIGLAAALLAHAQIEMTPIQPSSVPLMLLLLGAALPVPTTGRAPHKATALISAILIALLAIAVGIIGVKPLVMWERHLREAAAPMIDAGTRLGSDQTQHPGPVLQAARSEALISLGIAIDARPEHVPTRIAASRLALALAFETSTDPEPWLRSARSWITDRDAVPYSAREWSWLARIDEITLAQGLVSDREAIAISMIESLEQGILLAPYNARIAKRLAEAHDLAGHRSLASEWAQRSLKLNGQYRLDPLKQFTVEEAQELERMIVSP